MLPIKTCRQLPLVVVLLAMLLALTACGRARNTPTPPATSAPTATPTEPAPVSLIDREMLDIPGFESGCDHPPEAQMTCRAQDGATVLDVSIDASTYARWLLRWQQVEEPLSGDETLLLQARATGNLVPNLYLVEESGRRVAVNLRRYGLDESQNALVVPLREIEDDEGSPPDFARVVEVQLVFEWAEMSGTLAMESLRFVSAWEEEVAIGDRARNRASALQVPPGFAVEPIATDLRQMTQIEFTPWGDMLVSLQTGRVWWYVDTGDGRYESRRLYLAGFPEIVGLLYDPVESAVWVGGRGQLIRTLDEDGNGSADRREQRLADLPWGRHQNNGLEWNPVTDPFTGEVAHSWIYFGLGSTEDLAVGGELNATVLRFPRDGMGQEDLQVVSRGNRNAYDLVWAPVPKDANNPDGPVSWQLFASENGPDFNDAPDEVNHIRWAHHYGFPEQFGPVADDDPQHRQYSSPVYAVTPHASADGLAYIDNPAWPVAYRTLYVSLFGEVFSPEPVGHVVERVVLAQAKDREGTTTYRGQPEDFVVGLDRPLPLATGPKGNLIVGDYATGIVYRVQFVGK